MRFHLYWFAALAIASTGQGSTPPHTAPAFDQAHSMLVAYWNDAPEAVGENAKENIRISAQKLPRRMEAPLTEGILQRLNEAATTPSTLEAELSQVLTPPTLGKAVENSVSVISIPQTHSIAVAYDVSTCASCSQSWLGIFQPDNGGKFTLRAAFRNLLSNTTVKLQYLGYSGSAAYVVFSGMNWGDAHNRVNVVVLEINKEVKTVWEKRCLIEGTVDVSREALVLKYWKSIKPDSGSETAIYRVVDGRIALQPHS